MKICVFSDIHGNGPAFRVAYDMIISEKADLNIFLGDLCGYYYDQLEIFSMLSKMPNLIAIMGNHDRMFIDILKGEADLLDMYRQKYGRSMDNLLEQEHDKLSEWLLSLPISYVFPDNVFRCFHGSPENPLDGYVYPDSLLDSSWNVGHALLLGHTHYRMHRSVANTLVVNPGSLGQPRDGRLPCYVVMEPYSRNVIFREVSYDKGLLKKKIDQLGDENVYLREILKR